MKITRKSKLWLNWIGLLGWAVVSVAALFATGTALYFMGLTVLAGYLPLVAVVILAALGHATATARKRRERDMLGHIEQAVRLNLPLSSMIWAAEQNESRWTARRLARLRDRLDQGMPLAQSLGEAVPEMSNRTVQKIAAAESLGQLPAILRQLARPRPAPAKPSSGEVAFYKGYPPALMLMVALVISVVMIFLIPKFQYIFADFHVQLPRTTLLLIAIARNDWIQQILSLALLIWLGQMIAGLRRTNRSFFGTLLHGFYYRVPILHRRILDRGMGDLCQTLAGAVAAGWPLDRALREAADMQDNALLQRRVEKCADAVADGMPLPDAVRKAKLPKLISAIVAPARSDVGMAQALNFLARHYQTRLHRAEIALQAVYIPIVVAIMGVVVGFVALSLFLPIVDLIDAMFKAYPSVQ